MRRLGILLGCAALVLGARAARADEGSVGVPVAESAYEGGGACPGDCDGHGGRDGHFIRWLTFHPTRTPHGVCSHHPCECCPIPLYMYFLGDCGKGWPRVESCEPLHAAPVQSYCPTCGGHP